jgi:hypothetical protein
LVARSNLYPRLVEVQLLMFKVFLELQYLDICGHPLGPPPRPLFSHELYQAELVFSMMTTG